MNLFQLKSSQTIVKSRYFDSIKPKGESLDGPSETIEFHVQTQGTTGIMLNESCLEVEGKIMKQNATTGALEDLVEQDSCGPINFFLANLFSKAEMSSGEVDLNRIRVCQNHVQYCRALLNDTSNPISKAELSAQMASRDEEDIDAKDPFADAGVSKTFKDRATDCKLSKKFSVRGRVCLDIFELDRIWLPGTELTIKLTQNDSKFLLMAKDSTVKYVFKLLKIRLILCKYKLYSSGIKVICPQANTLTFYIDA